MFSRLYCSTLFVSLLSLSYAQESVPADLSTDFALELQASFTNNPSSGFQDGDVFSEQEASADPTFALGDSTGVNTALEFLMLMVDTTCTNARTLHFAQSGFAASGTKTQIASNSEPDVAYQPPGAFGETGKRQYSFLMYIQDNAGAGLKGLPQEGSPFDVQAFEKANGLDPADGGIGFFADLGGAVSCGSQGGEGSPTSSTTTAIRNSSEGSAPATTSEIRTTPPTGGNTTVPVTSKSSGAEPSTKPAGTGSNETTTRRPSTETGKPTTSGKSTTTGKPSTTGKPTSNAEGPTRTSITTLVASGTGDGASSTTDGAPSSSSSGAAGLGSAQGGVDAGKVALIGFSGLLGLWAF